MPVDPRKKHNVAALYSTQTNCIYLEVHKADTAPEKTACQRKFSYNGRAKEMVYNKSRP